MKNIAIISILALSALLLSLSAINVQAFTVISNQNQNNVVTNLNQQHHDFVGTTTHVHIPVHISNTPSVIIHSGFPFIHHTIIVVHRTILDNHQSFTDSTGNNLPIIFVKGVGFVAPINCQLTSNGDQIKCDFESVSVN
jgi:hypothetical protein